MVNMDTRTVLSSLKISEYITPFNELNGMSHFGNDMILSYETNHSYTSTRNHLSWLTGLKSKYDLSVKFCPITEMPGWKKTESEVVRDDKKYFKIVGVKVTISNSEVASWCQPLIQPMQQGLCAFIIKKINGVYHFLVQAKLECGNFDVIEFAPTVQCLTGNIYDYPSMPPFTEYVLQAKNQQIIFDTLQSEEGGRFFKEQNRNMIVEVGDDFPLDLPQRYTWMTLRQIYKFLCFNNYLNIQARSLISAIPYK
jgi:oxidase EvaA